MSTQRNLSILVAGRPASVDGKPASAQGNGYVLGPGQRVSLTFRKAATT